MFTHRAAGTLRVLFYLPQTDSKLHQLQLEWRPGGSRRTLAPKPALLCGSENSVLPFFSPPPPAAFMFLPSCRTLSPFLMEGPVRICHQNNAFGC